MTDFLTNRPINLPFLFQCFREPVDLPNATMVEHVAHGRILPLIGSSLHDPLRSTIPNHLPSHRLELRRMDDRSQVLRSSHDYR